MKENINVISQKLYEILYDKQQDLFYCYINNELVTAEEVEDLMYYVAKTYSYQNWSAVNLGEYVKDMQEHLDIKIVIPLEDI